MSHGGKAPQVRLAAAERIAAMVHPALDTLRTLLGAEREDVRLGAAKDVLDRAGYGPTVKIEVDRELERALDGLSKALKPEEYARVLEALAAGDARAAAA